MPHGATDRQIEHLLRRAGFGARPDELAYYGQMSISQAVDTLVNYTDVVDDVDSLIGQANSATSYFSSSPWRPTCAMGSHRTKSEPRRSMPWSPHVPGYNLGLLQICMLRLGTPCGIVVSNLAAGSATRPVFNAGSSINDLL